MARLSIFYNRQLSFYRFYIKIKSVVTGTLFFIITLLLSFIKKKIKKVNERRLNYAF